MDVGFVGLGSMGQPMARNLLRAGHHVTVWNRTRARAEALAGDGATVAGTPAEAARGGVVLTMVSDDRALEAVVSGPDGLLAGLPRGGLHVSMSTIGVATAERLLRGHEEAGRRLVSAPVFGRPDAAAAAKLSIVAAGREADITLARPLFEAMGRQVLVVGARPPEANLVKLAGNFLITAAIEGLAEATAVVAKGGVDRRKFLEVLLGTLFDAPVYRGYGSLLVEERFSPPGFALPLGIKDNRLLLEAGERLAVPLPLASLVRDRMLAALARGWGDLDWSVFARISAEEAGLSDAPRAASSGATSP
ncbi:MULTISPECIES: NAD(P)-dependent oxidoreductase [Anaeromyxobacter]|uniref:NAD(P)-dependent oxidoreductase n=1 Tax=Anaeromyxobacter TaxID=161492 RepID=UPI001F56B541|nr:MULTISPECIES: NAD(P)-dependent oxidoreductase [unclassified Anaeromyxobacter]